MRRDHVFIGCLVVPALLLAIIIYVASVRIEEADLFGEGYAMPGPWQECAMPLPDRAGHVVFREQRLAGQFANYDRQLRFRTPWADTDAAPRWLPRALDRATQIEVYWIAADGDTGPWLRLQEPEGEYLADLRQGSTYVLLRDSGETLAGEIHAPDEKLRTGIGKDGKLVGRIGDRPAVNMTNAPATQPGRYLGCVDSRTGVLRYRSPAEAPEDSGR